MRARLGIDAHGLPRIELDGETVVDAMRTAVPAWEARNAECVSTPWEPIEGKDALGPFTGLRSVLVHEEERTIEQTLRDHGSAIVFTARFLRTVDGTGQADSFEQPSLHAPRFGLPDRSRVCLATHGLGASDDPFGGYWPTAHVCDGDALPSEAFAPMVVFREAGALAIAPFSHFLTGCLVATPGGAARGTHGSIDRFDAETEIATLFVPGRDVAEALMALGDVLLRCGGKRRPSPSTHPLSAAIGWWNAYGGYYTEPIHPLTAPRLKEVIESIRGRGLPIRYLGLDLWYPYRQIGQAIEFAPDPEKYPDGIGDLVRPASLPTVLHVSALAQPNAYGSDGGDGSVYETIGDEIRRQEGFAVWHDWMRTQQHLTSRLRNSPDAAESWYRRMTGAFAARGLDVLQCMQTMGMALASTQAPNVRSARTSIDYLFALPEAIESLAELGQDGFRREALRPVDLNRQNLLMGTFLYALGLLPFHDLFLSAFHPGLGGAHPEEDAVLRALSCGPVGIGDAPGRSDERLLSRLILPDGRLLQPDRPPFPVPGSLGTAVETYWTLHRAGDHAWIYVVVLNLSPQAARYDVGPPLPGDYTIRNGFDGSTVARMSGELAAGRTAYYVLSPLLDGICPLGLAAKFVPAPADRFVALDRRRDGIDLTVDRVEGTIDFLSREPIEVRANGRPLDVRREGELSSVDVSLDQTALLVRRR